MQLAFEVGMSSSAKGKVDRLIALCDKKKPLSASDVAFAQKLLAAIAGVSLTTRKSVRARALLGWH